MKLFHPLLLLFMAASLTACAPNVETRGHVRDTDWKTQIKADVTVREEVLSILGSPSTVSTFGEETWYYITSTRENRAFLRPDVTEQDVVRVIFNTDGTVKAVEQFDAAAMRDFAIENRETPTEGHQLTVVEQMVGNLGRFNAPSNAAQPRGNTRR